MDLVLAVLLLGSFATALAVETPVPAATSTLLFERCTIGDRHSTLGAECTKIDVAIDPLKPDGEMIELSIARLRAQDRSPASDPLVFIAGGPGQSAQDTYPSVAHAFRQINRDRDILLIDQRGTGESAPLDCEATSDEEENPAVLDPVAAKRLATECLGKLEQDTRLFSTSVAVADLEHVRRALGVARWNLYGVSYGTRVALHYARRHPAAVRSLLLDAVVPPGSPLGPDIAPLAQRSLDLILARCLDDRACATAFPDIDSRTASLLQELEDAPVHVRWENIADGRVESTTLARADLAVTLRLLAYSSLGASLLPSMLDDAIEERHFAPFARQAALQSRVLSDSLFTGLHFSVICTEDLPFVDVSSARNAARDTFLGDEALRVQIAVCDAWPAGRIDADFHDSLALSIPSLILSGEADPVTPPSYGNRVATMLGDDVLHIVNSGQGHMQATLGCLPSLMAEFVVTGTSAELSLDCLERLSPTPFFLDANGPHP